MKLDDRESGSLASGQPALEHAAGPTDDQSVLREKAREVVGAAKMPERRPDRMWGGPGTGIECAICGSPVTRDQLEFEVQFGRDGDRPGPANYHVHVRCFTAWQSECLASGRPRRSSVGGHSDGQPRSPSPPPPRSVPDRERP
jgi:hypothetical protein